MLRKRKIAELDKVVKTILRKKEFHVKQASDKRLYGKRGDGARGLKSFRELYEETKVRVAWYMATSTNQTGFEPRSPTSKSKSINPETKPPPVCLFAF